MPPLQQPPSKGCRELLDGLAALVSATCAADLSEFQLMNPGGSVGHGVALLGHPWTEHPCGYCVQWSDQWCLTYEQALRHAHIRTGDLRAVADPAPEVQLAS